jgi:hypothetical protein
MWIKWRKGAWTWLKARVSSGRTNNARKGVDESVWAVQLVEHAGKKVTKGIWSCWEKEPSRGGPEPPQAGRPRPVSLPYKWNPLVPVFCRQVALSFLSLCAQVFVPKTTVDIDILPELDCSNNSHH